MAADLQWLVTAYVMMSGGGLLLGGRISDLLSRRGVFLTGLALFTVASLVSGFADSGEQLIAARAVQGLSAALLTPSALSLITTTYAGAQRKAALAMWGVVGSLGVAAGVLVGGAVTTWTSWQSIFWINVPIGARRPDGRAAHHRQGEPDPPDWSTSTSPAPRRSSPVSPHDLRPRRHRHPRLVVGPHRDRADRVSAVLLHRVPHAREARSQAAVPPHVWKLDPLVSGTAVMLGVTGILVGAVFLTSIFLQTVLGYSALRDRGRVLAVRARHHGTARCWLATCSATCLRGALATAGLVIASPPRACCCPRPRPGALRDRRAPRPGRAGSWRRHGLRAGLGDLHDRDTGLARRGGVRLPDDRSRGRRRARRRRPLRGRQHGGFPDQSTGAADAFSRGFIAAAAIAVVFAVFAAVRMPATRATGGAGGMHMH